MQLDSCECSCMAHSVREVYFTEPGGLRAEEAGRWSRCSPVAFACCDAVLGCWQPQAAAAASSKLALPEDMFSEPPAPLPQARTQPLYSQQSAPSSGGFGGEAAHGDCSPTHSMAAFLNPGLLRCKYTTRNFHIELGENVMMREAEQGFMHAQVAMACH